MIRNRRLANDKQKMEQLNTNSDLINVFYEGDLPEKYIIVYKCKGLAWYDGNPSPSIVALHKMEIYLHKDYPRRPPRLIWKTDIFHPNILSPKKNGGVCLGTWTPSESIDKLCIRIGEMVQYKNYNMNDPLNKDAVLWVRNNENHFPIDNRPLYMSSPQEDYIEIEI